MKKLLYVLAVLLISFDVQAALLTGQTPGSYSLPSGWSLVRATDFEGTKPAGEAWELWDASIQTDRTHMGTKSLGGTYSRGQADVAWRLWGSSVGSYSEIYLSFYEYIESQALFNDELFLARFGIDTPFQEVLVDWYWAYNPPETNSFNGTNAALYAVPQGVQSERYQITGGAVPKGSWVQWEIHYRPNTPGSNNGFIRVYKNGSMVGSAENVNLNGTVDMNSADVQVGGVYTKAVWMMDYPTCSVPSGCSTNPGNGMDMCTNEHGWAGQSFSSPVCNPIDPPLASFKRYYDDIIVMKLAGAGGGYDAQPPYTTSHAPAKSSTGVAIGTTEHAFTLKDDRTDDEGTTQSTISMTGPDGTKTCTTGTPTLTCTGTPASYAITYPGMSLSYDEVANFTLTATDGAGNILNESWSWTVESNPNPGISVTTTTLSDGEVGTSTPQTLASTGGVTPHTWSVVAGSLPGGRSLSPGGELTGEYTTSETVEFTVQVADSDTPPNTDNQVLTQYVAPAAPTGQTTATITTITDTWLHTGEPDRNYSDNVSFRIYQWPFGVVANRILLQIDHSSLPANISITSAALEVYLTGNEGSGGTNPMPVYTYRVTGTLPNISTVTWNTFAGTLGSPVSITDVSLVLGWKSFNVLEAMQASHAAGSSLTLALDGATASAQDTNRIFASMDHATEAWRPRLKVTYTQLSGPPPAPSIMSPGKLRISAGSKGRWRTFH